MTRARHWCLVKEHSAVRRIIHHNFCRPQHDTYPPSTRKEHIHLLCTTLAFGPLSSPLNCICLNRCPLQWRKHQNHPAPVDPNLDQSQAMLIAIMWVKVVCFHPVFSLLAAKSAKGLNRLNSGGSGRSAPHSWTNRGAMKFPARLNCRKVSSALLSDWACDESSPQTLWGLDVCLRVEISLNTLGYFLNC